MLSLLALYLGEVAYTCVSILLVGAALLALMQRGWLLEADTLDSSVLLSGALGFYWSSLVFAGFYIPKLPLADAWIIKLALDGIIIGSAICFCRPALLNIFKSFAVRPDPILIAIGFLIGTWAFFSFPHVLDSGQLKHAQILVLGGNATGISMLGYTGLAVFAGQLFDAFPVVVTAATFKPLLVVLTAAAACHAVRIFDFRYKLLSASLLFGLIITSYLGTYGIIELGKDSIFGVIFSFAFLLTLCREDAQKRGTEMAIYFSAAATTGIIAVPFMGIAYMLWLIPSLNRQSLQTLKPLYLLAFPVLPFAVSGFMALDPLTVVAGFVAIGVLGAILGFVVGRMGSDIDFPRLSLGRFYLPFLLILILICYALMPAEVRFKVWSGPDGNPIFETRKPLDGTTSFIRYLFSYRSQDLLVFFGMISSLGLLLTREGKTRPGLFALITMSFLLVAGALSRIALDLKLLSDFNIWDLTKDFPQWYAGIVFALTTTLGLHWLLSRLSFKQAHVIGTVLFALVMIAAPLRKISASWFLSPVTYTQTGGFKDRDLAVVTSTIWTDFRNIPLYVDEASKIGSQYFFDLQMFGSTNLSWFRPKDKIEFTVCCRSIGLIISSENRAKLEAFAQAEHATILDLATVNGGETQVIKLQLDGAVGNEPLAEIGSVEVLSGTSRRSTSRRIDYDWVQLPASLKISSEAGNGCLVLRLFSSPPSAKPVFIHIERPDGSRSEVNVAGTSLVAQREVRIPLRDMSHLIINLNGQPVSLDGSAKQKRQTFGLVMPVKLTNPDACRSNLLPFP